MLYVILIIVLINLVLPIAVSNRTRFLQERVAKKLQEWVLKSSLMTDLHGYLVSRSSE